MCFLIRALATLVLMLAVPLQGFAASSMLLCRPGHGPQTAFAQSVQNDSAMPAADTAKNAKNAAVHHDHKRHSHRDGGALRGHDTAPTSLDQTQVLGGDKIPDTPASGKCSVCAACCLGAAIVGDFTVPLAIASSSAVDILPQLSSLAVTQPGLERPPRV